MNASGAKNTRLDLVKVNKDGSTKVFGTTPVTDGKARAVFTVRGGKELRIVAQDSKTTRGPRRRPHQADAGPQGLPEEGPR